MTGSLLAGGVEREGVLRLGFLWSGNDQVLNEGVEVWKVERTLGVWGGEEEGFGSGIQILAMGPTF